MKTRIKHIEDCSKLFKIEIPREMVKEAVEEVYRKIKKVAKIPGFRPGSVPRDLLEKHFRKDAEEEVLKNLIPEGYKNAINTHKVSPIGMPRISNINFEFDKPLTFEAEVDTRPNTKLKNYKGIKVTRKRIAVSQEELDETFLRLRNMYAEYNDVERPVKKGDYAICDVEAFADGKPISKKNKNMWIAAEKDASMLGLGEELVGLTKGQAKEIETELPENYPDKKYAGKAAKFKVLVTAVKEKRLPELDEAFAKKLNSENMEALKKAIESQLFLRKQNALEMNMKDQILNTLLKTNKFSVPASFTGRQKEVLAKRFEEELLQKGMRKDEAHKKVKELDAKLGEDAEDRVRVYFILDDIAAKENIEASDANLENRLKAIAVSTSRPEEEVRKYYEKENLLGGLAEEIKEAKVLEFLLKHATVIE